MVKQKKMAAFGIHKVTTLPATPLADRIYIYKDPVTDVPSMYITEHTGGALKLVAGAVPGIDDVLGVGNETDKTINFEDDEDRASHIEPGGVFSNGSDELFYPSSSLTTNASVVGLLFHRNPSSFGISAAVAGIDGTDSGDGSSRSYGGYFNSAHVGQLHVGVIDTSASSYTIPDEITLVISSGATVYLPSLLAGRVVMVKSTRSAGVDIYQSGGGSTIVDHNGGTVSTIHQAIGDMWMYICDGSYWYAAPMVF